MLQHHGPKGWLKMPGQPGALRVPQRLAPGAAQVASGRQCGAGHHGACQDEAEFGHGGATGGGVQVAQPQNARPER